MKKEILKKAPLGRDGSLPKGIALYGNNLFGEPYKPLSRGALSDKFVVPPFSILDGTSAFWRRRLLAWNAFGFRSELGREDNLLKWSPNCFDAGGKASGASGVFDPVLCELSYRWYCPPGGMILDPFAGGSVRGLVAGLLGHGYTGVDLRKEQVAENKKQAREISALIEQPKWVVGDSRKFTKLTKNVPGDFIFSSPPYFGREHYSDLPEDLNNSDSYGEFLNSYRKIISQVVSQLRPNRFACFEVAEVRDKQGIAPDFVGGTIRAFVDAGAPLYNHAIHRKPSASARIRTNMFTSSRKLVMVHEHVLVFVKGDPKKATQDIGETQFGVPLWSAEDEAE